MNWKSYPLKKLCDIQIGATPARKESSYWGGKNTWVTVRELNDDTITDSKEHITNLGVKNSPSKLISKGTLLFSFKLSIGKMAFTGVELFTNEAIAALPIKKGIPLDQKYLYYTLKRLDSYVGAHSAAKGKLLNKDKIENIIIPLPPPSEQRRIVEILDQADRLRKLRAEADKKAKRILPALFIKIFGEPATNPMGWPTDDTFGTVGTLDRGKSRHRPRNAPELLGGNHPLIQTGDVANSGGRIRKYTQTYSDLGLAQSKMWPQGTLCITIAANIAKTGVLEFPACFPDSVVGFHPGPEVTTEYVQSWLFFLQPVLESNAPQAAQKNINLQILRSLPIPKPPLPLQEKFTSMVIEYYKQIDNQIRQSDKLEILFKSILYRAFTGDLTASWREAHIKELIQEMELQAKALKN